MELIEHTPSRHGMLCLLQDTSMLVDLLVLAQEVRRHHIEVVQVVPLLLRCMPAREAVLVSLCTVAQAVLVMLVVHAVLP
jgi:hypothetical protein